MTLADNAGLDVIATSEALNCYLDEKQATRNDLTSVDVTPEFLVSDLRQMLTGYIESESGKAKYQKGLLEFKNFSFCSKYKRYRFKT